MRHFLGSSVALGRGTQRWVAGLAMLAFTGSGCMTLSPQLPPTDFAELEAVEDREERERLYAEEQIYRHSLPQGTRYTKGTDLSTPRSWQSLDAVLRSDANSAAALPTRQLRRSRLFAALTVAAGILTIAGAAASAREGLNLGELDPAGGVLLGGGLATVGFAITSGVFYGKSRAGYENAVDIYNDSLGMRLGILDGSGRYVPPRGALVDADGNVVLDPGDAAAPRSDIAPPEDPPASSAEEMMAPSSDADGSTDGAHEPASTPEVDDTVTAPVVPAPEPEIAPERDVAAPPAEDRVPPPQADRTAALQLMPRAM